MARKRFVRDYRPSKSVVKSLSVFVAPEISESYHHGFDDGTVHSWDTSKELNTLARVSYESNTSFQWTHYFRGFKDGYERRGRSLSYGTKNREFSD